MKYAHAAIACLLAVLATTATAASAAPALPGDSVYQLSASLTDAGGHAVRWRDLRGKPRVASMFYTSCRYVCPLIVDSLKAVERQLSEAERAHIGFVLVSMDPARDTPQALTRVMSERRLDPERWTLLRPRPEDLRAIAGMLDVRYRGLADGEFNHTTTLVLLDADGRVLARTDRVGAEGDLEFLAAVRRVAAGGPAAASGSGPNRVGSGRVGSTVTDTVSNWQSASLLRGRASPVSVIRKIPSVAHDVATLA